MARQPLSARRIQEAILDELARQVHAEGSDMIFQNETCEGERIEIQGTVDVQEIAIALYNLVADR